MQTGRRLRNDLPNFGRVQTVGFNQELHIVYIVRHAHTGLLIKSINAAEKAARRRHSYAGAATKYWQVSVRLEPVGVIDHL